MLIPLGGIYENYLLDKMHVIDCILVKVFTEMKKKQARCCLGAPGGGNVDIMVQILIHRF